MTTENTSLECFLLELLHYGLLGNHHLFLWLTRVHVKHAVHNCHVCLSRTLSHSCQTSPVHCHTSVKCASGKLTHLLSACVCVRRCHTAVKYIIWEIVTRCHVCASMALSHICQECLPRTLSHSCRVLVSRDVITTAIGQQNGGEFERPK